MKVVEYLNDLKTAIDKLPIDKLDEVALKIKEVTDKGRRVFIIGNGGSFSTASHMVCDLAKGAKSDKLKVKALSLDNPAIMTALANDIHYEDFMAYQLDSYFEDGDMLITISASGNSPNVIKAVNEVKNRAYSLVGFTGKDGGELSRIVDINITVESDNYGIIEDLHLAFGHILKERLVELSE